VELKFLVGADVVSDADVEVRRLVDDDDDDVSDRHNCRYFSQYTRFYEHYITTFLVSMFSITVTALNFNYKPFCYFVISLYILILDFPSFHWNFIVCL
jgi:hypothetical protein